MSVIVSPIMSFNYSERTDTLIADEALGFATGSNNGVELFPDLADVLTAASSNSQQATSNVSKKSTVIKIKMESNEDEKVLMEYLLGKSNNTSPVLEVVTERSEKNSPHVSVSPATSLVSSNAGSQISPPSGDYAGVGQSGGLNKNALSARLNRQKKKKHVEELEESVKKLKSENDHLKLETDTLSAKVGALETELKYLKGVLANQSELAGLLKNIGNTPGVTFHSTLATEHTDVTAQKGSPSVLRKRKHDGSDGVGCVTRAMKTTKNSNENEPASSKNNENENSETVPSKNLPSKAEAAGVCLHVSNGSVSIEFCSRCNNIARKEDMGERQQ